MSSLESWGPGCLLEPTPAAGVGMLIWTKPGTVCLTQTRLGELLEDPTISTTAEVREAVTAARQEVFDTIALLRRWGIVRVCLGVSWCDSHCYPGGWPWISWTVRQFAEHFEVMPRVTYTPPPLSCGTDASYPPRKPHQFAQFLIKLLTELGPLFGAYIELWNEPNLDTDWKRACDRDFSLFLKMIATASLVVRHFGKEPVLGGSTCTDEQQALFNLFARRGLFHYVPIAGFHNLRGTWSDHTPPPPISEQVAQLLEATRVPVRVRTLARAVRKEIRKLPRPLSSMLHKEHARTLGKPWTWILPRTGPFPRIWLTEYGFPPVDTQEGYESPFLEMIQVALLADAERAIASGEIERVYWYAVKDNESPSVRHITTGKEDVLQYYMGIVRGDGTPRLLGTLLERGGPAYVRSFVTDHDLFELVDQASLGRTLPDWYGEIRKMQV